MQGASVRTAVVVAVSSAVVIATLAACTRDDPEPTPSTTVPSSSPPTSTALPTPQVPELPEAATRYDQPGAEAFVRYWFDLANYAQATGDTQPLRGISEPECVVCEDLADQIDDAYRDGGRVEGRTFSLSSVVSPDIEPDRSTLTTVVYEQGAGAVVAKDGTRTEAEPVSQQSAGVVIDVMSDAWVLVGIGTL